MLPNCNYSYQTLVKYKYHRLLAHYISYYIDIRNIIFDRYLFIKPVFTTLKTFTILLACKSTSIFRQKRFISETTHCFFKKEFITFTSLTMVVIMIFGYNGDIMPFIL